MRSFVFRVILVLCLSATICMLFSCGGDPGSPKPAAYPRIDLPEKSYQPFDSGFPYRTEYPVYAKFVPDARESAEPYWADIVFSEFSGRVHLSYKAINHPGELAEYLEDSRTFVHRHIPKATAIDKEILLQPAHKVYGTLYRIRGKEAASPLQFFATDSVNHFLRGALYFDVRPNNDSLAPVIHFIEEDIRHLFHSLRWEQAHHLPQPPPHQPSK